VQNLYTWSSEDHTLYTRLWFMHTDQALTTETIPVENGWWIRSHV